MKNVLYAVIMLFMGVAQANAANVAYMSAPWEPWNVSSNVDGMNAAFGSGNWDRINFGAAYSAYGMLYVDGGADTSTDFFNWVGANQSALEAYVTGGGVLFLNAAGWSADGTHNMLFGSTLTEDDFSSFGYAVNPADPLFTGAGSSWEGSWFSHDSVGLAVGMTALITGDASQTILASGSFGSGFYMLGGQTSTYYHDSVGGSDPFQLRVNELLYAAGNMQNDVPEPASLALVAMGFLGLGFSRRRKA